MHISEGPPRGKRMTDSCTKAGQGTHHHPSRGVPWGLARAHWLLSVTPSKQTQAGAAALQDPWSSSGTPRPGPTNITQQGTSAVLTAGLPFPGERRPPLSTCLHPLHHPTSAFNTRAFLWRGFRCGSQPGAWKFLSFFEDHMFIGVQLHILKRPLDCAPEEYVYVQSLEVWSCNFLNHLPVILKQRDCQSDSSREEPQHCRPTWGSADGRASQLSFPFPPPSHLPHRSRQRAASPTHTTSSSANGGSDPQRQKRAFQRRLLLHFVFPNS